MEIKIKSIFLEDEQKVKVMYLPVLLTAGETIGLETAPNGKPTVIPYNLVSRYVEVGIGGTMQVFYKVERDERTPELTRDFFIS